MARRTIWGSDGTAKPLRAARHAAVGERAPSPAPGRAPSARKAVTSIAQVGPADVAARLALASGWRDLSGQASFAACALVGAKLRRAELGRSRFVAVSLARADLDRAGLEDSSFVLCSLAHAKLSGTRAQRARFALSRLAGTRFHRSKLAGARFMLDELRGALFDRATGLSPESFRFVLAQGLPGAAAS